jgi:hypothetical protein
MHLIQFPKGKGYGKAIRALLDAPRAPYLALPHYQMVVTDEHVKALEEAKVSFVDLSKTA